MGETKLTFKRYEKKYLLSPERYAALRQQLDEHIVPDVYFKSTVCSIYYDSDDYQLIRHSIESPVYKEKLRVRSYARVTDADDTVFVELKKKYQSVVYKRRLPLHKDTPEKEMIDKLRCRNGNLEITISQQETVIGTL